MHENRRYVKLGQIQLPASRLPTPSQSYPQVGRIAVEMWKKGCKEREIVGPGSCNDAGVRP